VRNWAISWKGRAPVGFNEVIHVAPGDLDVLRARDLIRSDPEHRAKVHNQNGHSNDRGCTKPGCTAPGSWCEAHHVNGWTAANGPTDIDKLTLACPPHNRLIENSGWRTRKRKDGRTQWLPPPNLDTGQTRMNNYHHPQRYLTPDENSADEDADGP
jgi:hypothetical protein